METAVTVKNMLETAFPRINVVLANYPPTLTKRMLSKAAQVVQIGVIGIIVAGEQIFSRLGITTPPQWYYSVCANSFRSMATSWLLGNFIQSFLENFGSFEVYCNGELVFSKLKENRFPGEIELRELIGGRLEIQDLSMVFEGAVCNQKPQIAECQKYQMLIGG